MAFVDLTMDKNGRSYHDLDIENGDLKTTDGFSSSLLMSILCERRATESEVASPKKRRGWWGNEAAGFDDFEIGSKYWLLSQARHTDNTLNNAINYGRQATEWYVTDGYIDKVEVTADYNSITNMDIDIKLFKSQDLVGQKGFKLWENTLSEIEF